MDISRMQQQATEYLAKGHYSEAIHLYEQCIEANPSEMSNYWHLGLARLLQGEELEAQSVWLLAITQATPENVELWMTQLVGVLEAEALRHLPAGNLQQAERIYWQILELNTDNIQAYYNLGTALLLQEKLDEAVACLQRAIEIEPDFAEAYQNLGYVFQRQENVEEAICCYSKALKINPDWSDTHYQLGKCFTKQGKLDEAIACFKTVIQIKPDYTQAYCSWGDALLEQGKLPEAIACFKKTILINPKFAQAYSQWRDNLAKQGQLDDEINSRNDFLKALQIQQDYPYLYFFIGNRLATNNNLPGAIACYKKALGIKADVECYLKLGDALAKNHQGEEAIKIYKKTLEINPEYAEASLNLGKILAEQDKLDEAIACFQKALEIKPSLTEVQYHLETVLHRERNRGDANACFPETVIVNPPIGVYVSTRDWAAKAELDKSNYIKLSSRHPNYLAQPGTPDGSATFNSQETQFESPETFVAIIPDGRVWFGRNDDNAFAIITPDNFILADISSTYRLTTTRKHPLFSAADLPSVRNLDETVAVVPGKMGYNYFHWMIDILPSLGLLHCSGIDLAGIEKIFINGYWDLPFQRETLKALGIPQPKVIDSNKYRDKYPHIKANRLVVPSPNQTVRATQWSCEFLRKLFLAKNTLERLDKKERLYISRKKVRRQVINESQVILFLERFGFKSVTLESLSVYEQASLFSAAEVVISPHGAGLTNTVFCSPGTKIIEIFSAHSILPYYWVISNQVGLEYYYLEGEGIECFYLHQLLYPNPHDADVLVNLDCLLNIMKLAGVV